ncbi:hypothetical protein [Pragia fontium]|uniref:hypothetical protein n=1 Tax=Pragia fontium TaxID=82985 RepID=UPI000649EB9B|nr:hypothetical protein [Pragia fontium]AKJ40820.1 hypothetical protein QQ39_00975 [Pragia fontium]
MKKDKLIGISLSAVAVVVLGGWLVWQFIFPSPIAQWVFYGEKPSEVRGYTYSPAKDSATGKPENKPAIPKGDGALLTFWSGARQCSLVVKSGNEKISITRFQDSNPQSVQVQYIDEGGTPAELNVQLGRGISFWTYADPAVPGDFIGWKFDNLAGKAVPVRYRHQKMIDGTQYKLLPNSRWSYEKYQNGKVVESKQLDDLPAIDANKNSKEELELMRQANEWLSENLQDMSDTLSVPIPDQWLNTNSDPCQSVYAEM